MSFLSFEEYLAEQKSDNINFYEKGKEAELEKQIKSATKKYTPSAVHNPVVVVSKLNPHSKDSWYGFHFEKLKDIESGKVKVGDILHRDDGSVSKIVKIIGQ